MTRRGVSQHLGHGRACPGHLDSLAQPCPHGRDRRHEAGDDAAGSPPEFTPDLIGGGDERS
jgi:hypothetical protein